MAYDLKHLIGGEFVGSVDGATFESENPATGEPAATVARGSIEDAGRAVDAARRAFEDGPWPQMEPAERGALLRRLAELIEGDVEELARREALDMGKPLRLGRGEMQRSAHNFRFFADAFAVYHGDHYPKKGYHTYSLHKPVGVVAAISPWNFPLLLATWKIAPALAAGNTVVLKPAEDTPLSAARMAELSVEAGLPPGVLNVLFGFGPGEAGEGLTTNPEVDLITFTGESNTGRIIMGIAAKTLKEVSLELGGKAPNLIFADADLDLAVAESIRAAFDNSGEICLAGSRIYVERPIYDTFLDRFAAAAEALKVGDPLAPGTHMGPVASKEHYEKVMSYMDVAREEGRIVTGGGRPPGIDTGYYIAPTIVTDIDDDARLVREEIFGPLVTVVPFDSEDEVVKRANATDYGLDAMLFTSDLSRGHRVSAALRAGLVWVNCFFVRDLRTPFGGVGSSGVGREGGRWSFDFFTEAKTISIKL